MLSCPTPWNQSAMVDVTGRDRKVILCGDACYLAENLECRIYSAGLIWNAEAWCQSIGRLRMMKNQGYDLWLRHSREIG